VSRGPVAFQDHGEGGSRVRFASGPCKSVAFKVAGPWRRHGRRAPGGRGCARPKAASGTRTPASPRLRRP